MITFEYSYRQEERPQYILVISRTLTDIRTLHSFERSDGVHEMSVWEYHGPLTRETGPFLPLCKWSRYQVKSTTNHVSQKGLRKGCKARPKGDTLDK